MNQPTGNKRVLFLVIGVIFIGLLFIGIFYGVKQADHRIYPTAGQLNLQNWDFDRNGHLSLNGQWDFYWNQLLTRTEIQQNAIQSDLKADVPAVWNRYKLHRKNLPGFGYATYRLKVTNVPQGKPLALRIQSLSTAYRLYIDDQFKAGNGKVGISKNKFAPEYRPQIIEFTPADTDFDIIIQAANFTYARGGMWYTINLGTPAQIRNIDQIIVNKDFFLLGALSVMALYYLSIFLLRREDKSSLYFVLMCFIFISRLLVYGNYLVYRLFPMIRFKTIVSIEYITVGWFTVFAALMIGELFPEETSPKVLRVFLVFGVITAAVYLLTPVAFFTRLIYLLQISAIAMGLYAIISVSRAFIKGKKDALWVLIGSVMVIICASHDMLYQNNQILSYYGELVQVGLFILLFMQSFVLSRRFSEAFYNVEALSQKLLKLDKIKDEFLANTSHELRTPLNGILGITEILLRGSEGELNNGQKQSLAMITSSCRRLTNLINDILDYSKLKHGDILLNIKPVKLEGLIQTVVKVFQQLGQTKNCEVTADLSTGLPPVLADETRVVQILYNLIGNAVKFTPRGYVKVSAEVNGNMLEICISDTGTGIAPENLADIFKSFEQVDTSLTRKHGGTGLGLSITKQLVELQGGSIRVQSIPGTGSEFYFTLPVAMKMPLEYHSEISLSELAASSFQELPVTFEKAGNGHLILLVDDDPVNLQSSATLLSIGGYAVTAVNNGKAALDELNRRQEYALVIMDIMMPEISGYELCRKIRERKSHFELPVLMLTSKTAVADIVTGFEAGANDYLPKPFEPEELLARVGTLVNLKKSVDKNLAAEIAFMQAQIKPHFLFNTMNTIAYFCDTAPDKARQLIEEFSNYLRYCFDFKNPEMYIPLSNEMSLVKSFVAIEKARFGDKLKVELNIDEVGTVKIPPLSIQPLVENAIRHGIRKKGGSGTVSVSVSRTTEGIVVAVTDDGMGIPREKLDRIFTVETGRGVGLWNIDTRLRKLFGRGLRIESEPGLGTRVEFIIPPEVSLN